MVTDSTAKARNWWKFAFFVALVAFEVAREEVIVQAHEPSTGNLFDMQSNGNMVSAEGQWFRSDSGSPLVSNATAIQCEKDTKTCIEAQTTLLNYDVRTAYASISVYDITEFTDTSVTYENDSAICATYRVHIDLAQKRVTASTDLKQTSEKVCAKIEAHIPMELSDSIRRQQSNGPWMEGHFLPLLRLIRHQ
ncbi:hypothetical protein [Rhodanobacter sp. MP7CTX1]|uniref:hypothetical protein n=1 Tax=Rhodanobacter sp. MP7CTX1 TaxID=2723084 RepID=UPI00161874B2|nr:hypothetical protein [Rhodanobacter sp. MP7CTX1]MBB6189315.1 hypothetical protein [Rhodanobacter sp. MP7CTX1]